MISSFLKKLLFARQFYMIDGKIEVLGKKQVMLPTDIILEFDKINDKKVYDSVKKTIKKDFEDYASKLGSSGEGMLKNIDNVFETFGLGKLEIVNLDNKNKKCIVRIHNPTIFNQKSKESSHVIPAIVSGTFSFLFAKDVNATQTSKPGSSFYEYVIK